MSARDRLAAALASAEYEADPREAEFQFADQMLAADPHLAQDIEDGAALRRLREALPERSSMDASITGGEWRVAWYIGPRRGHPARGTHAIAPTIATAADKAREALA